MQEKGEILISTEKNLQVVQEFFATMGRRDTQGLQAFAAEDIE
jgi:ketosteroid isomerase-like protein